MPSRALASRPRNPGLALALGFVLLSCVENTGLTPQTSGGSSNVQTTISGTDESTDSSLVKLSKVVPNSSNPSTTFDLVGDGSGVFTSYCTADSSGKSNCTCHYEYIRSDGREESYEVDTSYVESNVIRCLYSSIPSDASYVQIKLHFTASDTYSSEVTYRFDSSTSVLDTANSENFVVASRYQCKDTVFVPHLFDANVYDPYQSEDPSYSYPLNFYSTNMGQALRAYATKNTDGKWDCPALPNDTAAGMDLRLWSVTSDGASKQIYPPSGSTSDRSTFYLLKESSGSFSVGVNAMLAPNVNTITGGAESDSSYPPIGYGVRPVTSGTGESCPSDVTIPSGFHWVKVWLFRASLTPRYAAGSSKFSGTAVSCNPGSWEGTVDSGSGSTTASTDTAIYPDCKATAAAPYFGYVQGANGDFADRLLSTLSGVGLCVRLRDVDGLGTTGAGYTTDGSANPVAQRTSPYNYTVFSQGTDLWERIGGDSSTQSTASASNDFNLYNSTYPGIPHDASPTQVSIDDGTNRFDFVFVVTPTTIMTSDMKNATSASLPYTPYRFVPPSACNSTDPDSPSTSGDCPSDKRVNYQIRLTDLAVNPDSPGEDSSRLPAFPVCAIQPD